MLRASKMRRDEDFFLIELFIMIIFKEK